MALKMSEFVSYQNITAVVNFPVTLKNMNNTVNSGYVLDHKIESNETVKDYVTKAVSLSGKDKIEQAIQLVKLDLEILDTPLKYLSIVETLKVQLAYLLLLQSKVIILEHFFSYMIYGEQEYFKRFLKNLVNKQKLSIILIENNMDFLCEYVKKVYLFTKGEKYKIVDNFYSDELYRYVKMPKTVELVKFLNNNSHSVDKEVTFNEVLKAIYRGVV